MKLDEVFSDDILRIQHALEEGPISDKIRRGIVGATVAGGIGLGSMGMTHDAHAANTEYPEEIATARYIHPSYPKPNQHGIITVADRKNHFINYFLKDIKSLNADIQSKRNKLLDIHKSITSNHKLDQSQQQFVDKLLVDYDAANIDDLLKKVNIIPPSLAIAQAAVESAWGRDPKAISSNVFFGQKGWQVAGTVKGPKGERYTGFSTPREAIQGYMHNLNTHTAYDSFRTARAKLGNNNRSITGIALAPTLHNYSTRGSAYTNQLQQMIASNKLNQYDNGK